MSSAHFETFDVFSKNKVCDMFRVLSEVHSRDHLGLLRLIVFAFISCMFVIFPHHYPQILLPK
jgi:hypothetical protein